MVVTLKLQLVAVGGRVGIVRIGREEPRAAVQKSLPTYRVATGPLDRHLVAVVVATVFGLVHQLSNSSRLRLLFALAGECIAHQVMPAISGLVVDGRT